MNHRPSPNVIIFFWGVWGLGSYSWIRALQSEVTPGRIRGPCENMGSNLDPFQIGHANTKPSVTTLWPMRTYLLPKNDI